jgi:DNA repair protein RAD5
MVSATLSTVPCSLLTIFMFSMLASLIHTNREGEVEGTSSDGDDALDEDGEPVAKRPKFRQLTLSKQWQPVQKQPSDGIEHAKPPHATLVVCPVSLAKQWQEELGRMSVEGSLNTRLWYGNERGDLDVLLGGEKDERVDVIITSYGTLASEHSKWIKNRDKANYDGGGLFDSEFVLIDSWRTCADERIQQSRGSESYWVCDFDV